MPHDSADLTGREAATHWGRGRPCKNNQLIPSAAAPTGNVSIVTSGHPVEPSRRRAFTIAKSIVIERNVWIAAGATIIGGVTVGENSVAAAGSVVTNNVPPILLSEETRRESFVRLPTEGTTFLRLSKLRDFRPEIAVAAVLISAPKTKAARGPLRVRLRRTLSLANIFRCASESIVLGEMRRFLVQFSEPVRSGRAPSWAGVITTRPSLSFRYTNTGRWPRSTVLRAATAPGPAAALSPAGTEVPSPVCSSEWQSARVEALISWAAGSAQKP
jgi:hypothetical protein